MREVDNFKRFYKIKKGNPPGYRVMVMTPVGSIKKSQYKGKKKIGYEK
jgi:hypothetical protein